MKKALLPVITLTLLLFIGTGCSSNSTPKKILEGQINTITSNINGAPLYDVANPPLGRGERSLDENVNLCKQAYEHPNCYNSMVKNSISGNVPLPHKLSEEEQKNYGKTIKDTRYTLLGLMCNDIIVACSDLLSFSKWEQNFVLYPELTHLNNTMNDLRDSAVHIGSYGLLKTFGPGSSEGNFIEIKELDFNIVSAVPNKIKTVLQELLVVKQKYGIK